VAYARNGTATVAQDFTTNHALAAKAIRLPLGQWRCLHQSLLALQDWRALAEVRNAKSILLFSSGINYFRGGSGIADPDWIRPIERARKKHQHTGQSIARDAGVVDAVRSALSMPNPT